MNFKQGLINARSHIIFMLGLIVSFGGVIALETMDIEQDIRNSVDIERSSGIPEPRVEQLGAREMAWARIAWKYFENNTHAETGLVNSVDNYPASTMWDTASYLLGAISAERLGLIGRDEFDQRMAQALDSLARLELFDDQLPNKSYNAQTLAMVNYQNQLSERGIGWSAIDIGRLLVPFNVLVWQYPQHTAAVTKVMQRWDVSPMLVDGTLFGATVGESGETEYVQEGRVGYEEYGAKSFSLMGRDVSKALNYQNYLNYVKIYGIKVPTDSRNPERFKAHNYVVSESYILDGVEFGWDDTSREFAFRVFDAQRERYRDTGILTAVSEDNIDRPPYFVYNTVFTDGRSWNAITDTGEDASAHKSLSTKAAFGWHALYADDYTDQLVEKASELYDADRGWYSGWYEVDQAPNTAITGNTNAIILESLHYRAFGPFLNIGAAKRPAAEMAGSEATAATPSEG